MNHSIDSSLLPIDQRLNISMHRRKPSSIGRELSLNLEAIKYSLKQTTQEISDAHRSLLNPLAHDTKWYPKIRYDMQSQCSHPSLSYTRS